MNALLRIVGWTFRMSAAICITWITVSVIQGSNGLTTVPAVLQSLAYHAVFALAGSQLVGFANRRKPAEAPAA